jgi:hypothetical protein
MTVPKLARDTPVLVQRSGVSRTVSVPASSKPRPDDTAPEPPKPSAIPLIRLP